MEVQLQVTSIINMDNICMNELTLKKDLLSFLAMSDYDALAATLTFAAGITSPNSLCDNIAISDDHLVEGDEKVLISATFKNSPLGISFLNNYAFITIKDNDCEYEKG